MYDDRPIACKLACKLPRGDYRRLMDENHDHKHLLSIKQVPGWFLKELPVNELVWFSNKIPLGEQTF